MIHQDQEEEKAVKYGRVLMDYGVGNNRRFINVTSIQAKLEEKKPGI